MKNGLDEQYVDLLKDILENGVEKNTRNGKVLSVFGRSIRYKFKDGKFPLLNTKKMYFKGIATELIWFLRGDTNIKYLVDNDCHIWVGDAYKRYTTHLGNPIDPINYELYGPNTTMNYFHKDKRLYTKEEFIEQIKTDDEFSKEWGDLGPIYGKQWRRWEFGEDKAFKNGKTYPSGEFMYDIKKESIDQISNLINDLKTNPDSRRMMVNSWNVGEIDQMTLPSCHYGFQVYTRLLSQAERHIILEKQHPLYYMEQQLGGEDIYTRSNIPTRSISLMWNQRSVDTFLGLPFNIASYGLLLEIIAKIVNMVPEELIGNLGDTHLYSNHLEQAKEQLTREPFDLPSLKHMKTDSFWNGFDATLFGHLNPDDFVIENYQSHSAIKAPLSN